MPKPPSPMHLGQLELAEAGADRQHVAARARRPRRVRRRPALAVDRRRAAASAAGASSGADQSVASPIGSPVSGAGGGVAPAGCAVRRRRRDRRVSCGSLSVQSTAGRDRGRASGRRHLDARRTRAAGQASRRHQQARLRRESSASADSCRRRRRRRCAGVAASAGPSAPASACARSLRLADAAPVRRGRHAASMASASASRAPSAAARPASTARRAPSPPARPRAARCPSRPAARRAPTSSSRCSQPSSASMLRRLGTAARQRRDEREREVAADAVDRRHQHAGQRRACGRRRQHAGHQHEAPGRAVQVGVGASRRRARRAAPAGRSPSQPSQAR